MSLEIPTNPAYTQRNGAVDTCSVDDYAYVLGQFVILDLRSHQVADES